jgi:hypothetical protein
VNFRNFFVHGNWLFSLLLALALGASSSARAFGTVLPCEITLRGNSQMLNMAKPLLQSLSQLTDSAPNSTVQELVDLAWKHRSAFLEQLTKTAPELGPVIQRISLRVAEQLRIPDWLRSKMNSVIESYGRERVPVGPTPLPDDVYQIWEPRFKDLSRLALEIHQFGLLGELIVVSQLPDVVAANISPHQLLSPAEQRQLFSNPAQEKRGWFRGIRKNNFEIDVLFNGGESIGEIKFFKSVRRDENRDLAKIEKQAKRLSNLLQFLADHGVHKTGYFIFFGATPSDAIKKAIENSGLHLLLIPYDFDQQIAS